MAMDVSTVQQHPWMALLVAITLCGVSLAAYRLYFHPLSHIPGPKLAAATQWYEFYYDIVLKGQYMNQFLRLHEKYGPIIRISPNELHCIDPAFIDQIYVSGGSGKKRDKSRFHLNSFQLDHSCFGTVDHDLHRLRRSTMNPFFSKASVTRVENSMHTYTDQLCHNLDTYVGTKEPCNLSWAFNCIVTDIITHFSFGWSMGYTKNRSFQPNLYPAMLSGQQPIHLFRHIPILLPIFDKWIPQSIASKLVLGGIEYFKFQNHIFDTVDKVLEGKEEFKKSDSQRTIFKEILEAELPPEEKSKQRLREGAREVIGAGTLTTAHALSVGTYYLLANPASMSKLYTELVDAIPDPESIPSSIVLEKLPYLITVLHEALRFSCGVSGRLPRIPHEPLHYTGKHKGKPVDLVIPPRSAIGMSTYLTHQDPNIFPEPHIWKPERWLDENGKRHKRLDPYFLAFSKGSRQCMGINLAWTELHIVLATLVRRFANRLELYETGLEEVEYKYDLFEPGRSSYEGIRVLVH